MNAESKIKQNHRTYCLRLLASERVNQMCPLGKDLHKEATFSAPGSEYQKRPQACSRTERQREHTSLLFPSPVLPRVSKTSAEKQ